MKSSEKIKPLIETLLEARLEQTKELSEKFDKLKKYITPLIEHDEEIKKVLSDINIKIIMIPVSDLLLSTTLLMENNFYDRLIPKICMSCGKKLGEDDIYGKEKED